MNPADAIRFCGRLAGALAWLALPGARAAEPARTVVLTAVAAPDPREIRFAIPAGPAPCDVHLRFFVAAAARPADMIVVSMDRGRPVGTVGTVAIEAVTGRQPPRCYELDATGAAARAGGDAAFALLVPAAAHVVVDGFNGARPPQLIATTAGPWSPGARDTNRGAAGAAGRVFYIDASHGDDANPGTSPGQAWQSLARVNAWPARPGDMFLFCAGQVFRGPLVARPGRPREPVIYGSYDPGGSGRGRATIQAPGGGFVPRTNAVTLADWVEVRDLAVVGTSLLGNYHADPDEHGQWLVEGRCSDVVIDNLTVSRGAVGISGLSSLYRDDSARWEILDTTVHDVGGTGIYVYGHNFVVRHCLVYDWAQEPEPTWGASQHGIYSRARQLEVYASEFHRHAPRIPSSGQPVSARGRDNVIEGCRIHDVQGLAIGYFPDDSDLPGCWGVGTSIIRGNICWNLGSAVFFAASNGGDLGEHWIAVHNTVHGFGGRPSADTAFAWYRLTGGAQARENAVTGGYLRVAAEPARGGLAAEDNRLGTPAQLGIPAPPPSPSAGREWFPVPSADSPLLGARRGAAIGAVPREPITNFRQ